MINNNLLAKNTNPSRNVNRSLFSNDQVKGKFFQCSQNFKVGLQKIDQRAAEDAALAQNVLDNVSACSKFLCTGVYSLLAEFTGIVVSVMSCILKFGLVMPVVELIKLIAECGKIIAKSVQKFAQYMKNLAQKFAENVQKWAKEGTEKCPSWGAAIKNFISQHQIAMLELLNIVIAMIAIYFGVAGGYIHTR